MECNQQVLLVIKPAVGVMTQTLGFNMNQNLYYSLSVFAAVPSVQTVSSSEDMLVPAGSPRNILRNAL